MSNFSALCESVFFSHQYSDFAWFRARRNLSTTGDREELKKKKNRPLPNRVSVRHREEYPKSYCVKTTGRNSYIAFLHYSILECVRLHNIIRGQYSVSLLSYCDANQRKRIKKKIFLKNLEMSIHKVWIFQIWFLPGCFSHRVFTSIFVCSRINTLLGSDLALSRLVPKKTVKFWILFLWRKRQKYQNTSPYVSRPFSRTLPAKVLHVNDLRNLNTFFRHRWQYFY